MDWPPVTSCFVYNHHVETLLFCCSMVKRHTVCHLYFFIALLNISFLPHLKRGHYKKALTLAVLVGKWKLGSMPEETQKNWRWLATSPWNSHTNLLQCHALFIICHSHSEVCKYLNDVRAGGAGRSSVSFVCACSSHLSFCLQSKSKFLTWREFPCMKREKKIKCAKVFWNLWHFIDVTGTMAWVRSSEKEARLWIFSSNNLHFFFFIRRSENVVKEYFGSLRQFSAFT